MTAGGVRKGTESAWTRAHMDGLATWGIRHLPRSLVEGGRASRRDSGAPAGQIDSADPPLEADASPPRTGPEVGGDKVARLRAEAERVATCVKCRLAAGRTHTVFGVGDPDARLMFVGEAPGREEDEQGEPFVGKAGQLLNRIIGALGVSREDVYIANVLKCRPPGNRDPLPDEVGCCASYLVNQIEWIAPAMIVALGRPAANFLLNSTASIARLRGGTHEYRGIPVVVTYHPAYLLRNPDAKKQTWQDLQVVIRELGLQGPPDPAARQ